MIETYSSALKNQPQSRDSSPAQRNPDERSNPSRKWLSAIVPYAKADDRRATFEVVVTFVPYVLSWVFMWRVESSLIAAGFAVLAALLLVRLFIIQHDCGHGSLFSSQKVNDWVGRCVGVLTLTPYSCWRQSHAKHHATSGNLDRRGTGDVDMLTLEEYAERSPKGRLAYRLYRNPLVLFGAGSLYLFAFQYRWPDGGLKNNRKNVLSAMGTNVAILALAVVLAFGMGLSRYLLAQLIVTTLASGLGIWLFYVQHQFEDTYWERNGDWNHAEGALEGSSYYDLPGLLRWFSGNIGIHHVHHISSRVAFFKLPQVLKDYPELTKTGRIGLRDSLRCTRLKLWDESNQCMLTFAEAHQQIDSK